MEDKRKENALPEMPPVCAMFDWRTSPEDYEALLMYLLRPETMKKFLQENKHWTSEPLSVFNLHPSLAGRYLLNFGLGMVGDTTLQQLDRVLKKMLVLVPRHSLLVRLLDDLKARQELSKFMSFLLLMVQQYETELLRDEWPLSQYSALEVENRRLKLELEKMTEKVQELEKKEHESFPEMKRYRLIQRFGSNKLTLDELQHLCKKQEESLTQRRKELANYDLWQTSCDELLEKVKVQLEETKARYEQWSKISSHLQSQLPEELRPAFPTFEGYQPAKRQKLC